MGSRPARVGRGALRALRAPTRLATRATGATLTVLSALLTGAAGCSEVPLPTDCGDATMSIVTFQGSKSPEEEDQIRSCVDIHAASRRDATAMSAGRDESFATTQPGVIPWTNLTFGEAIEACGRAGKFLCNSEELQAVGPEAGLQGGSGALIFDETAITALSPTGPETEVAHRFDLLNPYDMIIRGETGKPAFPETSGSVVYWTSSPERFDNDQDPSIPLILGRLSEDRAVSGYLLTSPVLDENYRHPLLGFRCCINAKMREAFEPVPADPGRIREEEDDVPIEEP
ncbi:hypothetical protein [Chondromyces apiculatus]|uniref:Uncharacterized protein n=1 Tax=Chondromyces apiculatus DSM 436 TaxID=1192034 RepID=A0A017TD87_9BACT|nr:hypothetical protein [Chondromyces apiculatus]EYF07204.1 Hypothetical protein CAP_0683 [Chondromyces apiculatus DSM 436]